MDTAFAVSGDFRIGSIGMTAADLVLRASAGRSG